MQVAYDGRAFHGFAPQPGGIRTVGGLITGALERVLRLPERPLITCAGRTDAGVHAWDQWAHVDVPPGVPIDTRALQRRLVKLLAPEIVVRALDIAPDEWDARRSAKQRTYRYAVLTTDTPDPFRAGFVWWRPGDLDQRAMQLASDAILGEHDFSSFCRADKTKPNTRTVRAAEWSQHDDVARFEITADAFCQQMVRSLVGTLVDVGAGRVKAGDMLAILHAKDRAVAGAVAPPDGLTLWAVTY
jgi:tRNA pseudouridine38-40 synthase